MKIYTKTGDKGETSLGSGKRLLKDSNRVIAYGEVDELNAALGICVSLNNEQTRNDFLGEILEHLQKDLWMLGADLASPQNMKVGGKEVPRVSTLDVERLEQWIDELDGMLPPLTHFITPGGNLLAAHLHFARTVCRRAERAIVRLAREEKIHSEILIYMNRLSDLLFVMSRCANESGLSA